MLHLHERDTWPHLSGNLQWCQSLIKKGEMSAVHCRLELKDYILTTTTEKKKVSQDYQMKEEEGKKKKKKNL